MITISIEIEFFFYRKISEEVTIFTANHLILLVIFFFTQVKFDN